MGMCVRTLTIILFPSPLISSHLISASLSLEQYLFVDSIDFVFSIVMFCFKSNFTSNDLYSGINWDDFLLLKINAHPIQPSIHLFDSKRPHLAPAMHTHLSIPLIPLYNASSWSGPLFACFVFVCNHMIDDHLV